MNYKIHTSISIILLTLILLIRNENLGTLLLLITGLYGIYINITISKKLKSKKYDLITPILITTIVYLTILFFYGLGNIGTGDKGLIGALIFLLYLIFGVLSVIINLFIKTENTENHKKILTPIAALSILLVFWPSIISSTATFLENPSICNIQIEIKTDSFIFPEGSKNNCLRGVGIKTLNHEICLKIKEENLESEGNSKKKSCLSVIAWRLERPDICRKINSVASKKFCLQQIAISTKNPQLCEEIDSEYCLSVLNEEIRD